MGELQSQKWRIMEKITCVRVPGSQEGFRELVAAALVCCALGNWGIRELGTGLLATGLPHPILILLLPPGDVNNQFSWSQEKTDEKGLAICRALF